MTIEKVDHIGIAVPDLSIAVPIWEALGLTHEETEEIEDQKVRVAKLVAGDDTIELIEPTGDDSPIAKFLGKRGPGIHHLCLKVDDLAATLARLTDGGVRLIDEAPRVGAGGCLIAFVHPSGTGGVLIELSQEPSQ